MTSVPAMRRATASACHWTATSVVTSSAPQIAGALPVNDARSAAPPARSSVIGATGGPRAGRSGCRLAERRLLDRGRRGGRLPSQHELPNLADDEDHGRDQEAQPP